MAYIPPQLVIDQQQDDRYRDAVRMAASGMGGLGQARLDAIKLEEQKKQALAEKQKAEKISFAEKGVSSEAIDQYHKTGDVSGIQKFLQTNYETDSAAKREIAKQDRTYKELQARKLQNEINSPDENLSYEQKAQIDAKYRAQNQQDKQPAQNEFAAAGYAKRARMAEADLAKLPRDTGTGFLAGLKDWVPNALVPENLQLADQAKRNFISANLRKESGAAIPPEEMRQEEIKYFPQPGDSDAVIAQKARAREQAILNLEAEGSRALPRVSDAQGTTQAPPSIQQMTPEQKAQRLEQLRAKKAGLSMGGR